MNYKEQLQTPQWKEKRLSIMKRDNFACCQCASKKHLQVHHKKYINGAKAWEIDNKHLITLCKKCHEKEHEINSISVIVKGIYKLSKKEKIAKKITKLKNGLSKRDNELQKRYDNLKIKFASIKK